MRNDLRRSAVALLGSFVFTATAALPMEPARTVSGTVIRSERDPAVHVALPKDVTYVGEDKWTLFGIAHCRLFAFVNVASNNEVRRLYWVQFESYLASLPRLHHTYDSKQHATLGGLDFYVDTFMQSGQPSPPDTRDLVKVLKADGYAVPAGISSGSDEQHIDALINANGYRLPPRMLAVRFVHTLDAERKELMIIYGEPFSVDREPTDADRQAIVRRAESLFVITPA